MGMDDAFPPERKQIINCQHESDLPVFAPPPPAFPIPQTYYAHIERVSKMIAETLLRKDKEYGGSWLKRGGVGAYMMKVRKSDRLEEQTKARGYDIFIAIGQTKTSSEKLADTLLDDAGYAILILAEAIARGLVNYDDFK